MVGDALVPFRPHVACSTNQAALDALLVEKMLSGDMTLAAWESQVVAGYVLLLQGYAERKNYDPDYHIMTTQDEH